MEVLETDPEASALEEALPSPASPTPSGGSAPSLSVSAVPFPSPGPPEFPDEDSDVLADLENFDEPSLRSKRLPEVHAQASDAAAGVSAAQGETPEVGDPARLGSGTDGSHPSHAQTSLRREMRDADWAVYSAASYESQVDPALEGKWEFLSPGGGEQQGGRAAALLRKRLASYQRQGLRRTVAPVFFCHLREYVHLLLLFHRETRRYSLFTFKAKSWERPEVVLERKLARLFTKHRSEVDRNVNYTWVADQKSEGVAAEVGEFLGEWWRVEFDEEPQPFLPPHVTRPKERIRLYQVQLPPKCSFRLPPAFSLAALPLFDLLRPEIHGVALSGLPHVVSRFRFRLLSPSLDGFVSSANLRRPRGGQQEGDAEELSGEYLAELERMNTSQDGELSHIHGATEELPPELAALAEEEN
ncbi:putative mrna cleavage factor family protein [Toxoplasma gondii VAND]|uniref:Putative mrna cleavage factor family protein n=2 Tax=Toxoplasma gondii TaxID=5811 RepID=A0A2T6IQK1_TOXGO|nr:putative mrna cleavage factor family protein [Toxoplasma gondii VAND]PUA87618.1 putative mrna cleavage factor family protein [Toxoplasma gondii TgCATBr9]